MAARACLFDSDHVAHHPEVQLFEPDHPPHLKVLHPSSVFGGIRHVHKQARETVAVGDVRVTPVPFDGLRFVTCCTEMVNEFEYGLSQPFVRNVAAVVELEWEQHLEW